MPQPSSVAEKQTTVSPVFQVAEDVCGCTEMHGLETNNTKSKQLGGGHCQRLIL